VNLLFEGLKRIEICWIDIKVLVEFISMQPVSLMRGT
jgi:hypothetical protein